jgi:aspartyl-tRNA(Asn)/glutamyl-tRNA(Gln) amidotransferase subunit A
MSEISKLDAAALEPLYRAGTLSPVEVAKDALARIERFNPEINAFTHRDEAETLAMARAAEGRWQAGRPLSALDGVPVTIKDNLAVQGWPNRRGSAVASGEPSVEDCPVAERLRNAGAVFLGKTTMPEYGWKGTGDSPLSGLTRNPWDLSTSPGGSSSGAVACAALNLGAIHIGTDGAGSIRIPAAFTGVFGIKPTYGRVPAHPISVMGFLAHLGPLTRTVRDAALAMNVIAGPDARDMTVTLPVEDHIDGLEEGIKGLRIAWSPRMGRDVAVDPDIARLTEAAARSFQALGADVEEADPDIEDPLDLLTTLWSAGAALALREYSPEQRKRMDPGLVAIAEQGEKIAAADYVETLFYKRGALSAAMASFHKRYDLLLTPTLPLPAFTAGRLTPEHNLYGIQWERWTPFTYPFNLTQAPAASVPCGLTSGGLPAGLQIVGAFGADRLVFRAARAFERASPFPRIAAPRMKGRAEAD